MRISGASTHAPGFWGRGEGRGRGWVEWVFDLGLVGWLGRDVVGLSDLEMSLLGTEWLRCHSVVVVGFGEV